MKTIEYNGMRVCVPSGWGEVKLKHYEKVFGAPTETAMQRINYLCAICDTDASKVLTWPLEVFDELVSEMAFLFEDDKTQPCQHTTIKGVKYMLSPGDKITLGEWVDAEEAQREEGRVLSQMLAIVCRPAGEAYDCDKLDERAAMFAECYVADLLGVLAFFLRFKQELDRITRTYSAISHLVSQLPRSIGRLLRGGVGIKSSQIWRIPMFLILTALLRYRVKKYSLS